jgi:predicted ATPase
MLKFGVSNLRLLKFVPPIELKPITILVGRNSSGKSTFLRAFPLLRQSLMTRTSSPVLWYGDLVDFGSFDISVTDNVPNEPISFSFVIDKITLENRRFYWSRDRKKQLQTYQGVHFQVSIIGVGERTRISRLVIKIQEPELNYEIWIGEDSKVLTINLNGQDSSDLFKPVKLQITPGTMLPEMTPVLAEGNQLSAQELFLSRDINAFYEPTKLFLKSHLKRLSENWLNRLTLEFLTMGPASKKEIRDEIGKVGTKVSRSFITEISGKDKKAIYPKLKDLLSISALPAILAQIRVQLRSVITSTLYIGPARARSERYYRYQDLAVSEIDPDGENFPMFLNSLLPSQVSQLSKWIEDLFGYGLSVARQAGGHMSIDLIAKGVPSNIVDNGYGVSQILPVLGQIWWARNRPRQPGPSSPLSLLAIEQPELHLHPAHQALLADALVGELSVKQTVEANPSERVHFLIETHSETMLNRLGELISSGRILNSDIQVIMFESLDEDARVSDVRTSAFSETGELINWPYGFFQPVVK